MKQYNNNNNSKNELMTLLQIASFLGASAVGLSALGAHALNKKLIERGVKESWNTAVLIHLFSATAILGISALQQQQSNTSNSSNIGSNQTLPQQHTKLAGQLIATGTVLFSGSVYCLCLGIGPRKIIGPTTPIGGMIMISGWIWLGIGHYF